MKADDAARSAPTRRAADSVEDLEYNKWLRDQPADARSRANLPEGVKRRLSKLDEKTGRSRFATRQADEFVDAGGTTQLNRIFPKTTEVVSVGRAQNVTPPQRISGRTADVLRRRNLSQAARGADQTTQIKPTS